MRRAQVVCVLAETPMSDGSRVVTQDLFPQYMMNNGVTGAVRAAKALGRYDTALYRDRERIGLPRRSRTWQLALAQHYTHPFTLWFTTGLKVGEPAEPEEWRLLGEFVRASMGIRELTSEERAAITARSVTSVRRR